MTEPMKMTAEELQLDLGEARNPELPEARRLAALVRVEAHIAALEQQLEASMSPPSALVELQVVKVERDAAFADNAALVNKLRAAGDALHHGGYVDLTVGGDHPGHALLEQHRKEVDGWKALVQKAEKAMVTLHEEHAKALVRAKDEGRTQGIREAMDVCKEEGHPEMMPCIADLLEEPE